MDRKRKEAIDRLIDTSRLSAQAMEEYLGYEGDSDKVYDRLYDKTNDTLMEANRLRNGVLPLRDKEESAYFWEKMEPIMDMSGAAIDKFIESRKKARGD